MRVAGYARSARSAVRRLCISPLVSFPGVPFLVHLWPFGSGCSLAGPGAPDLVGSPCFLALTNGCSTVTSGADLYIRLHKKEKEHRPKYRDTLTGTPSSGEAQQLPHRFDSGPVRVCSGTWVLSTRRRCGAHFASCCGSGKQLRRIRCGVPSVVC